MTLTTIIGAFLAVIARPAHLHDKKKSTCRLTPKDEPEVARLCERIGKLAAEVEALGRSQGRLIDYIERLERQVAMQESLVAHWKEQAQIVARHARREQESFARQQAALEAQGALHLQQYQSLAQQNAARNPLPFPTWDEMNPQSQQNAFADVCNCVPSRSQVFGANAGLVNELNRLG